MSDSDDAGAPAQPGETLPSATLPRRSLPDETLPADDGLDAAQRAAVRSSASALLVVAGPGSGKTRVLTHRIAWRSATESMQARRAMAVTFTRRAAHELRTRLRELDIDDMGPVGTFHSIALAQVRRYDIDHGRAERKILPSRGALSSELAEHLQRAFGPRPPITVAAALREIDWAKASSLSVAEYREGPAHRRLGRQGGEAAAELFKHFERTKSRRRLLDFDDLLAECTRLMRSDEHFAAAQRWLHRHFFVDEFQDLNRLQWELLGEWIGGSDAVYSKAADICAVGDIDQAIYGWNGADSRYVAGFERHFEGAQVIRLELNYRSHPSLVTAAQAVMAPQTRQRSEPRGDAAREPASPGELSPDIGPSGARQSPARPHETGPVPTVTAFDDVGAEADGIARWIADRRVGRVRWGAFGVLARTNGQLGDIATALNARAIPYRLSGQRSPFLQLPAVRELLERFRTSNVPFAAAVEDLRAEALDGSAPDLRSASTERSRGTSPRPEVGERLRADPRAVSETPSAEVPAETLLGVLELAEAYLAEIDSSAGRRSRHIGATGDGFASWAALLANREREFTVDLFDRYRLGASLDPRDGAVTLATFHAAKGLQWPHVVIAGAEDGLVPLRRDDLEERRLFYVAVSRASRTLHFTWARHRSGRGTGGGPRSPSPWLELIEHATAEPPPLARDDAASRLAEARAALGTTREH
ncbi:ATP-dependent helicase [Candidatus Poriferisodalis sp.]|uniref:ATP-dependent helicase n=1 Tax=Candidatus Poriferisodalis sp. TaxID=3101277 RepID=UPI003B522F1F